MKKKKDADFITLAVLFLGGLYKKMLDNASRNCLLSQEKTLRRILKYAKNSAWGRAHGFSKILRAKGAEELFSLYRKNVPPQDYEDFRPFVEECASGQKNVLFPGKPLMYATTSGTTSQPKWIPITKKYYKEAFKKMTALWLYTFLRQRPGVFFGKSLSIVGRPVEGYAADGTVFGSVSGVTQRDCPNFIKGIYSAPSEVFEIKDYKARYYTLMRTGIEHDISVVVTANPSTIIELQKTVDEFLDDFILDIERGTLNEKILVENDLRKKIESCYKPNPVRANELRLLKEKYGRILPKHYWPGIQLLTTWKCGNTGVYTEKLSDFFPKEMAYQEFGYFASECRAGLVLDGTNDTVLFPHVHYFEFVDFDQMESPDKKFLGLHELKRGSRYLVYVTTCSGLYRYNMNDLVECTGTYNSIPKIQFIQKVNGIVSMTGEKISERQFMSAVQSAEKEAGLKTHFFVGFADVNESAYHFYYEFEKPSVSPKELAHFTRCVDICLSKQNQEWESKRLSFRVKDPVGHILEKDSFEKYKAICMDRGARDGQFKMNLLMQDEDRHSIFKGLAADWTTL